MANNPEIRAHKEWLGFLQPVGLIVSAPALVAVQAVVNRNVVELQQRLLEVVSHDSLRGEIGDERFWLSDFPAFAINILGWQSEDLVEMPEELAVLLPEYNEVLTPSYAVPDPDKGSWLMLVQVLTSGTNLDQTGTEDAQSTSWHASPQSKFERLLREKEIPIGLLCNSTELRLVYAPRGESSGHLTFPVQAMCEVSGRLLLAAMEMLLSADRLFNVPSDRRLAALLEKSRKYQNDVSTKLSEQVLEALWELLRGFQTAHESTHGRLLSDITQTDSQHIYGGLITILLRLVFLLYAEDRGLMPQDAVYTLNYSVSGLYERLREDAGNYPDTMDQRYGAWAWLLSLFRLVYDGGGHAELYLPARHGQLFDPDEYPFLESRPRQSKYRKGELTEPPRISDGVIHRVLQGLLVLDGERLSYRSLDVEQIGSVYEAMTGYEVERATSPAIGVWSKPKSSKSSVTVVVSVEQVLKIKASDRAKFFKDVANCEISGKSLAELAELRVAKTPEDVVAALGRKLSPKTPSLMPVGSLYLQPGEERRRSGSHYTPRALTTPIVRETLRPILSALGENPAPKQILDLKICDLAMGSGAFLVETCRQLAESLVEAWNKQGAMPEIPPDEEPLLYARRLVAQRCLYGVDKNPFAVNLAKLSLWLATLAKAHPFTFLDHALECGDALVGLTRDQIINFNWEKDTTYDDPELPLFNQPLNKAKFYRDGIQQLGDENYEAKRSYYENIEVELRDIRLKGDLALAAFFSSEKDKARKDERDAYWLKFCKWQQKKNDVEVPSICEQMRQGDKPVIPFHWEIEFPEVFERENPGFDGIVGNPPFAGKNTAINAHAAGYLDWLKAIHPESHGNSDLVAHFFRQAFTLLRQSGSFGLIATNTIAQGDTRSTGLRYICQNRGTIYHAQKRLKWPGLAAVVVSVINIFKGDYQGRKLLNGRAGNLISAFLFHSGRNENPKVLQVNANKSFQGSIVLGMGFTFDNYSPNATPIAEMHRLIEKNPQNAERVFPYIGGEEVNSSPTHVHHRYVINFGEMNKTEASQYSDLIKIVEEKVKPERLKLGDNSDAKRRKNNWWLWGRYTPALFQAITPLNRVLVTNCGATAHLSLAFLPSNIVFANSLAILSFQDYRSFAILQSRSHEIWARFFGSSMKDDLRYTPSDCFETFPFPENWEIDSTLEAIGKEYYEYRAALMVRNNQGLTNTYNRFHEADERHPDILKLRELHTQMDRAVLDAYGWPDISTDCTFVLDYEDEEEEENSSGRQKKKPWRYRWPEDVHDEVLARLLELNQKRAEEERLAGTNSENKSKQKKGTKKTMKVQKTAATSPTIPDFPSTSGDTS